MKDTAVYKGKTYGFCSSLCKDEFKKNPEKYVQK
ncbi:MAG: YHS domain-containing protein [Chryseobacterium sp.]|nr:YHS domain-containing protein [Chryseobacterium sp.]